MTTRQNLVSMDDVSAASVARHVYDLCSSPGAMSKSTGSMPPPAVQRTSSGSVASSPSPYLKLRSLFGSSNK